MYTRSPKRKIQQVAEEQHRDIITWRAEATQHADWEALAWIDNKQQQIKEPTPVDHHQNRKRAPKQQWKFFNNMFTHDHGSDGLVFARGYDGVVCMQISDM